MIKSNKSHTQTQVLSLLSRLDEAEVHLKEGLAIIEKVHGQENEIYGTDYSLAYLHTYSLFLTIFFIIIFF